MCLATTALHLELMSDFPKYASLAALNRFIARRWKPRNIFSDNGTTFVGTFNLSDIDPDINFSFIPAYTSHMGGIMGISC